MPLERIDFISPSSIWSLCKYFLRGNLLSLHRLFFPISTKGSFICTGKTSHTIASDGPVVGHWLELKIAQPANAPCWNTVDKYSLYNNETEWDYSIQVQMAWYLIRAPLIC